MDLNYLLHRHQISLARSTSAESKEARCAHAGFVQLYARKIDALRATKFPPSHAMQKLAQPPFAVSTG